MFTDLVPNYLSYFFHFQVPVDFLVGSLAVSHHALFNFEIQLLRSAPQLDPAPPNQSHSTSEVGGLTAILTKGMY